MPKKRKILLKKSKEAREIKQKLKNDKNSNQVLVVKKRKKTQCHGILLNQIQSNEEDNLKEYKEAEKCFQKALKINPNFANAHNRYANLLKNQLKEYKEAEIHYQEALKINPNYADAHNNYANLLKNHLKKYKEAEIHYQEALKINPNFAVAH